MSDQPKATYQPVRDDGAPYKCPDCGERKPAREFWYYRTPNGAAGLSCKECIDPDWLAQAEFNPKPI